jgi:uncharacterized surface protein with fasciclin (FAS1) repeats
MIIVNYSCQPDQSFDPGFEDMNQMSILDFITDSTENNCSSFLEILKAGELDKTLSAYNPDADGYTLFLPDNAAVERFIQKNDKFNTLNDLLNDKEYVKILARYHVINKGILANDFPFGAFPEPTLSKDYLTVTFVVLPDTAYYKINNQAPVLRRDIEASNGYVHLINEMLEPITYTTYKWLQENSAYSIFKAAVDLTGFKDELDFVLKDPNNKRLAVTLLVEPDSIYKKYKINSINDLIARLSPNNNDYKSELNPLYNFVGYHLINGNYYLDDFEGNNTNYSTQSDIPLNIDGTGIDIKINNLKQVLDTIIKAPGDTTFIKHVGINYDNSNVISQSGAIHFIDHIMYQQRPSMADVSFDFYEESYFDDLRAEIGDYIIDSHDALNRITWPDNIDLFFVKAEETNSAWNDDFIQLDGDFSITYRIPKVVQGKYNVIFRAEAYNSENALVGIYVDGKKVGGLIDLSTGGSNNSPFRDFQLGTIDFVKYEEHNVEVRSLIPGRFLWDNIRFEVPEY